MAEQFTAQEQSAIKEIDRVLSPLPPAQASNILEKVSNLTEGEMRLIKEYPQLKDILFDPTLTKHQKHLRTLPFLRKIKNEQSEIVKRKKVLETELEHLEGCERATKESTAWITLPAVLEKNDCTRLHHLGEAFNSDRVVVHDGKPLSDQAGAGYHWDAEGLKRFQPFVVQHDWAKAFDGATDYAEGQIKLPYDDCIFEFRISGKTVIIFASQNEAGSVHIAPFVQFKDYWIVAADMVSLEASITIDFLALAAREIRAISIALDAEVATHKVVRAPHALNIKREREGRVPVYDHHIVQLSGKHKIANALKNTGDGVKKRLHFRRGHWRHFASFKTWVRWTLVGDPSLGFVDKEYRL